MNTLAVVLPIFNLGVDKHRVKAFDYVLRKVHAVLKPNQIIISEQTATHDVRYSHYDKTLIKHHCVIVQAGEFNKAKTINAGVAACTTDLVLILDGDVALDWSAVAASAQTLSKGTVCKPFSEIHRLTEHGTFAFTQTSKLVKSQMMKSVNCLGGGAILMYRDDFNSVNGFDERYVGWGAEDAAFGRVCKQKFKIVEIASAGYHLYHPRNEDALVKTESYKRNQALFRSTKHETSTVITETHPLATAFSSNIVKW